MELLAIYYKLIVLEPLLFFVIFQIILSPRQVVVNERFIAHFFRHFKCSPHASTYNLSCVDEVRLFWQRVLGFVKYCFLGKKTVNLYISGHLKNVSNYSKLTIYLLFKTGNNFALLCEDRKTHRKKVISS